MPFLTYSLKFLRSTHYIRTIRIQTGKNNWDLGSDFLVLFFSGSRPLALKSPLKRHEMTTITSFIQNEDLRKNYFVLVKNLLFWTNKNIVIWWLFDNDLRTRARENKNQKTPASVLYVSNFAGWNLSSWC